MANRQKRMDKKARCETAKRLARGGIPIFFLVMFCMCSVAVAQGIGTSTATPAATPNPAAGPTVPNAAPSSPKGNQPNLPPEAGTNWWAQAQKNIAAQEYQVTRQKEACLPDAAKAEDNVQRADGAKGYWQAPNRAHDLRTCFTDQGPRVVRRSSEKPEWTWGLEVVGLRTGNRGLRIGEGASGDSGSAPASTAGSVPPVVETRTNGNSFEYRRGSGLVEWYINDPKGLEQGFTIAESAIPNPRSEIAIDLAVRGDLRPGMMPDGKTVEFLTAGGVGVIHYGALKAVDTAGKELPARMELASLPEPDNPQSTIHNPQSAIRLVVDARNAKYPVTIDPLATTASWTAGGDQHLEGFGVSSTAGDVNGDGYSDVIISAPGYDNGQMEAGKLFVYYGSASGLSTAPNWTAEGNQDRPDFGSSVATAGDVNGDGYSDVIVGAPRYGSYPLTGAGQVFVYFGSASGLSPTPNWTATGTNYDEYFGYSVSTAGDVNGDGYSDVIIGAPGYRNGEWGEGGAFVYYGSASGLSHTPSWTAESNQINTGFGNSVSTAGDVNGDGYSDVIVGDASYSNGELGEGRAFVYCGSASGLSPTPGWTAESDQVGAGFGHSVSTAGDVNGDGYSDVIVGADGYDNGDLDEGCAFVYYGSASGLSVTANVTLESNQSSAYFGRSVSTAGDVNGDGYADVIVAASWYDNGQQDEGRAYVYYGSASGLSATPNWTAESNKYSALFGDSVSTAGDVNGDGYSDVIVGAPGYADGQWKCGRAFVYYGSPSVPSATPNWTAEGDQTGASFGFSVSTAGDVNGDGYADVIVGAPKYDGGTFDLGRVFVYHGSASGLSPTPNWTMTGTQYVEQFGFSVSTAGDVNGDGYSDVIVGAPYYHNQYQTQGGAFVYFGSASGLSATANWTAEGHDSQAYFGWSVSTAGDVNGDGYSDVIVGERQYSKPYEYPTGAAFVYCGSAAGLSATPSWMVESDQIDSNFGASVSTAGDVNGDGYSDVIVGAYSYDNVQTDKGRAFVYHGSASGLSTTANWTAEGYQAGAAFGWSVSTAGDVNGDGYSDVIVGGAQTQRAFVYYGSISGLSPWANWTAENYQVGASFGQSVSTAGDVNGDGYSDVIVGAPGYDNGETDEGRAFVYFGSASGLSTTANWTAESDHWKAYFGSFVSTAGDVNGDGYSDVIVGAPAFTSGNGWAYVYYGNGEAGRGLSLNPIQRFDPDGPGPLTARTLQALGKTNLTNAIEVRVKGRTPFGRGKAKLQVEVKSLGTPFNGSGLSTSSNWTDIGTAGTSLTLTASLPPAATSTANRWRARLLYHPVTTPFQQVSRWVTPAWNAASETDFRVDGFLVVFQTDSTASATLTGRTQQSIPLNGNSTPVTANEPVSNPAGYHFVKWTVNGLDYSTSNPLTVTNVTTDMLLTAVFLRTYTLTYTAGPNGAIVGATQQTVAHGASGTPVTAVTVPSYRFWRWSDGSRQNPRTDTNVTGDISVTAEFIPIEPAGVRDWQIHE